MTIAEFLESTPPNQIIHISDLSVNNLVNREIRICLNTAELELHCTSDSCNGVRFFRCISAPSILRSSATTEIFVIYSCSNCQKTQKRFALSAVLDEGGNSGLLMKYGEYPTYGPPTPAKLLKLIGPDRDNFLKGRRCENQGLGVGAFAYYRRVVEHQKNRILEEIIKVSEKINAPPEKIDLLTSALSEDQFTKAMDIAKAALPESLLINGHNPLKLLYTALSEGIHNHTDEDCLGYAASVRVVLAELSERLSQALKDEAEILTAVNRLLATKAR